MTGGYDTGWAISQLKAGHRVRRAAWTRGPKYLEILTRNEKSMVYMYTAEKSWVPWWCSTSDFLAEDWELVQQ